jgi:hypothetical protein
VRPHDIEQPNKHLRGMSAPRGLQKIIIIGAQGVGA